ncbi:MAG: DNA polymerase III subunit beta [Ferrimicrobium sp.]
MKLLCDRDQLTESLAAASRALSSRSSLSGVRWAIHRGILTVEGRESDLSIRSELTVVSEDLGRWTTPAALAVDLCRSLPSTEVEVVVEESATIFRSGRAEVSINLLPDFEIPAIPLPDVDPVEIPAAALLRGLHQVATASSRDENRDLVYAGMLFSSSREGLRLVATDGVRLALRDIAGLSVSNRLESEEVILPTRAVRELDRLLTSSLNMDQVTLQAQIGTREAVFRVGNVTLATRLIDEPFRDYRRLVDVPYSRVMLADKGQIVDALRRLRRMAKEARNASSLRMQMTGTSCELSVRIPQVGEVHEVIDVNFSDDDFSISFDPDLLADGIDGVDSDVVRMEFLESNRAASISNSDSREFMYLLMPIVQKA